MKYKKQIQLIAAIVTLIVFPVITFYLMEAYTHNPFEEVRPWAQFFNILLFELLAWIFVSVTGKIQSGLRIELVTAMIYGISNAYVVRFRTNPIVPWDIFSWKTAASVASNYDFKPDIRMIVVTLAFLGMIVLLQFVKTGIPKFQLWKRLIPAGVCCIVLVLFVNLLQDEDFQTGHRLYPFLFTPAFMTQVNGVAVTFAMDLAYMTVEKPAGYDAVKEQALLESYAGQEDDTDSSEKKEELPNIIVVMNESFSDLNVLGDFTTNEDYMPYLHSLQNGAENTVTGYLNVSVCGGNTANTEFEFLTGNSMAFLPQGSIPYQQYIKSRTPSLAGYLKSLGYATYAQHPYQASGWNRDKVYPLLGFDNLDFMEDYRDVSYVRNYISDASDMEHIIETYEKNKASGKPAFIFNVTMQNHGGYTDTYMNLTNDIQSQYASEPLNQYLTLIHKTDQALENLIDYFSKVDDRTIIVFFGDHQPNDTVASVVENGAQAETQKRYLVPYLVWSNYGIEGAKDKNTSLNYLAAQVLTAAGVPTNAYQNYLLSLSKTYPVISAAGQTKGIGADEKQLQTYKKLQYYQLFEKNKEKDE